MNRKVVVILIILLAVVAIAGFKFVTSRTGGIGGLKIVASPQASIFLNDKLIGKTPYDDEHKTGEYILKLIPEGVDTQTATWQGKIVLNRSVLTYVNRDLGISELTSAGEILTLEKISRSEAQLAVISQPDATIVILDGQERGTTPLTLSEVSEGEHEVAITSPGFTSRTVRITTTSGYKLLINFQLALSEGAGLPPTEAAVTPGIAGGAEVSKPYILIKDTPTGFLRVRLAPSTGASEAAQVKPGDKYSFLEEREGWYKIYYEAGKEGWVSGRYAEKAE